jgi:periplasmic protein TonB
MDQQNLQVANPEELLPASAASRATSTTAPSIGSLTVNIEPWYVDFIHQIRDFIRPEKLPPLQVTSRPVAVKDLWAGTTNRKYTTVASVLVHVLVIGLLIVPLTLGVIDLKTTTAPVFIATDLKPYELSAPPAPKKAGGGGGGGDRSKVPASKGALPKAAKIQLAPPQAVIKNPDPIIPVTPTIIAPPEIQLPQVNMDQWGDPLSTGVLASNGTGIGGGIGSGSGTGVGPGKGPGFGPGEGGGAGGGAFRVGGGVSAPQLVHKVDPEYSEQARKSKFQGAVVLSVVVQKDGTVRDIRVVRSLGLGLDEKAMEAVKQWRFRPGERNGQPVDVLAQVEVTFRLL